MNSTKIKLAAFLSFCSILACPASAFTLHLFPPMTFAQETSGQISAKRVIGAIKAINGSTINVAPDSGAEVTVTINATATHIRRIAPGEKDLKNATTLQLQDLQVGDRILVAGKASDDGKSLAASTIVVMKRSDVEAKQEQERQDWQKRGLGGSVCAMDTSAGTVTISVTGACKTATKTVAVKMSKSTVFRRYAPNSVKFDDAKPSTLPEIHTGDQLRARGERSADGSELNAEEIVTGTFPYVEGTVNSVDASSGTISVQDLLTKKPVQIKITSDSQLHKLPPEMAQRMAIRLKAAAAGAGAGASAGQAGSASSGAAGGGGQQSASHGGAQSGSFPAGATAGGTGGGMRQGGAPDLNQMLARTPVATLADLNKGDAVVILATEGSPTAPSIAITLVTGVEPILRASPSAGQAMMLAPWSLGGPAGDAGSQ
jgi:hypothetical protein